LISRNCYRGPTIVYMNRSGDSDLQFKEAACSRLQLPKAVIRPFLKSPLLLAANGSRPL